MARKKNPDSSWHHRTELTLGDPGSGVVGKYVNIDQGGRAIACDMRDGGR